MHEISELRDMAKSRGLKDWSRLRKANLIPFITDNEKQQRREARREAKQQRLEKLNAKRSEHKAKRKEQANQRKARQEERNEKNHSRGQSYEGTTGR